jgi:triosephosphate isomerase
MLAAVGAKWVIVGHSERRQYFGETNETVLKRTVAALAAGLNPIVCVGEKIEVREAGGTEELLEEQFNGGIASLSPDQFAKIVLAYEPVWAIGTGKTATPEIAEEAHRFLRSLAAKKFGSQATENLRILYGGSVKPDNSRVLMSQPDIDGTLVGGASLDAKSFAAIVNFK